MGKLFPLVLALIVGGAVVYLYSTGQLAGVASGANTGAAGQVAGQGVQKAKDAGSAIYAQPWFWSAAVAAAAATAVRYLWKNMNGRVRGALIAVATVAATVFLMSVKR